MKKLLSLFTWLFIMQCLNAQNTWTRKADFGGGYIDGAVGFSIGSKGYIGTGWLKKDFWEYNPSTNTWTQKANFGGAARGYAVGFSIGSKGYIGTGMSGVSGPNPVITKDFWEYDPAANTWTRKADFGGTARFWAVGFSIGSKGYIGTGDISSSGSNPVFTKDFWEYDPATNTWIQKADFGGTARSVAVGFSIGSKGYIGTGYSSINTEDFWEYDPAANTWVQEANVPVGRSNATGFSVGTKGYIGSGFVNGEARDFYEFNPATHGWTAIDSFPGGPRYSPVGFSIGNKGYVGVGSLDNFGGFLDDFWEYTPSTTLPVTLTNVKAYQANAGVQIDWTTQQESNIEKYEVEKSNNAQQFSYLASVPAKGNSSVILKYNLFDPNPFAGVNFYRIKTIDKSGQATYSEVIKLNISRGVTLLTVYPNPVKGNTIVLQMNNLQKGNYNITLSNKIGQTIITKVIAHAGGSATQTIEPGKVLAAGVYQLRLTGGGINIIRQVIKN